MSLLWLKTVGVEEDTALSGYWIHQAGAGNAHDLAEEIMEMELRYSNLVSKSQARQSDSLRYFFFPSKSILPTSPSSSPAVLRYCCFLF